MGRDGDVGDGVMPDSPATIPTGARDLGRGRWQGEGQRSVRSGRHRAGVRLTDVYVRAGLSASEVRLSQYCHIARALTRRDSHYRKRGTNRTWTCCSRSREARQAGQVWASYRTWHAIIARHHTPSHPITSLSHVKEQVAPSHSPACPYLQHTRPPYFGPGSVA